ncbi:hypothetical protein EZV62_018257 [Acer yangbiense]|uniref:DEP domain-containing protein n=1 Tax=Acer yangbiense TaxID=1000413 RepID=A0A5C7HJB1_9ROSI|nr:hypothetical protein EZV62_018257 [Acer yangbiense]
METETETNLSLQEKVNGNDVVVVVEEGGDIFKRFTNENISVSDDSSPISNSNGHAENAVVFDNNIKDDRVISAPEEKKSKVEDSMKEIPSDSKVVDSKKINGGDYIRIVIPHSQLPKPEAPPGLSTPPPPQRSISLPDENKPWIGNYLRERSNNFSAAIAKKLSSFKENNDRDVSWLSVMKPEEAVTQINISGMKVIVKMKSESENEKEVVKGRISFFSRSKCRDCTAVRTFFRQKGLRFVEINIDVYREREKELIERTGGSSQVPQIFFNDKLFGGLVALNSLRNSGGFDHRLREMLGRKCSSDAPAAPVYGFDDQDQEEEKKDEMVDIIRFLRQRLPIQDRLMKMKIVKNCFSGSEMVEVLIQHLDCGRKKAIEIGKQLSKKHFIHHVFGENEFEDGNNFYRFLEHETNIQSCYNFRGSTNDNEPKAAALVGQRLAKIMSAILESYASNDGSHVDYGSITRSEEFRRYVNLAQDVHRLNLHVLTADEKLAFFLNLHNAMVIHAIIRIGHPEGVMDRKAFFSDFQYIVGGYAYSINTIKNGILRNNHKNNLLVLVIIKQNGWQLTAEKVNPLIHFGLCNGTKSSPRVRFFTSQGVEAELRSAAREFFQNGGMDVNLEKRTVYLSRIIKWFNADFGQEKQILKWMISYLDATKAGLLTHLMDDGGPINIVYQNYDWSPNS